MVNFFTAMLYSWNLMRKIFFREEFKLENFLPKMVLESNILKKKDLKKLLFQNLNWFFEKKFFNITNIQIEYLKCMNELLQFSGRIYFVNLLEQSKETFIIVGSNYGVATFIDLKSKTVCMIHATLCISWRIILYL